MRGGRWAAATLLALIAGCDAAPGGFSDFDSGDTADEVVDVPWNGIGNTPPIATGATTTSQGSSSMMGTQVGSEGFWTCPVLGVQDLGDGTAALPSLGAAPVELVAARVGTWPVQMTDLGDGELADGALELVDEGVYLWVDVTETGDCVDHLAVAVRGELQRDDWKLPMTGVLAIRPDDGRMILTGEGPLADVETTWGPTPLDPALTAFRVEVGLDATALAGTASYVDCTAVTCAGAAPLATLTGAR
jgi:hypothetical protein